jgi:hypothetical protein
MQLNKFEKSLNIVLKEYGHTIGSPRYIHFIIVFFFSASFFNTCLYMGIESIRPIALAIFRRDKDPKNENRIKELLIECNTTYIKGKLNLEISAEKFRQTMAELAHNREEISEEYAWRVCGILTEKAREEFRESCKRSDKTIIESLAENMYYNPQLYPIEPRPWIESFFVKFYEKVPELSKRLS